MEAFKLSFIDDWKEWSTAKKALSIIGVCCIGLIIIGVLFGGAMMDKNTSTPAKDNNNSNTNNNDNNIITYVCFMMIRLQFFNSRKKNTIQNQKFFFIRKILFCFLK